MSSLKCARKRAHCAPSDGAVVEAEDDGAKIAHRDVVALGDRRPAHPANAENAALGRVQHRREPVDAEAAQVGHGERAAFQITQPQLARARPFRKPVHGRGDVADAQAVGAVDDGDDETVLGVDADAEIDVPVLLHGAVDEGRVQRRVRLQSLGRGLEDDVVYGRLDAMGRAPRVHPIGASLEARGHVDLDALGDLRCLAPAGDEPLGDGAPNAGERHPFDAFFGRRGRSRRATGVTLCAGAAASGAAGSSVASGVSSPASPIQASVAPMRNSTPSTGASTSIVALSVSTESSGSPSFTSVPSRTCHSTTRPFSMVWPRAAKRNWIATSCASSGVRP